MFGSAHLSDAELDGLDEDAWGTAAQRRHLASCASCRGRADELRRLRALVAATGRSETRPAHDIVPGAMMRLRLRRYSVTNANELLGGIAGLIRGLVTLFSLDDRGAGRRG